MLDRFRGTRVLVVGDVMLDEYVWGAVSRIDMIPATCGDPSCEADHGYEGTIASDDISLRISADADGEHALNQAMTFARSLSATIGR